MESYDQWIQKEHKQFVPLPAVASAPQFSRPSQSQASFPPSAPIVPSRQNPNANRQGTSTNSLGSNETSGDSFLDALLEEDVLDAILECEMDMMTTSSNQNTASTQSHPGMAGMSSGGRTMNSYGNSCTPSSSTYMSHNSGDGGSNVHFPTMPEKPTLRSPVCMFIPIIKLIV